MAFWLITTLIFGHGIGLFLILLAAYFAKKPVNFKTFFNRSLRDYILIKAVAWETLLLFTGIFAVYEFISLKICEKCLAVALEFTFIIFPLIVCCANPLLSMWFVLPVRNASIELCPRLKKFLPEYDLVSLFYNSTTRKVSVYFIYNLYLTIFKEYAYFLKLNITHIIMKRNFKNIFK